MVNSPNKAVNSDAFFVRCAHYKCAGYGWRYASYPKFGASHRSASSKVIPFRSA